MPASISTEVPAEVTWVEETVLSAELRQWVRIPDARADLFDILFGPCANVPRN